MTIVAAFKCKVHFNPSCAALSSKRALKHFHSKDWILTICFMGHLLCHGRPTQIASPPCWYSSTADIHFLYQVLYNKKMYLCLLKCMTLHVSKHSNMTTALQQFRLGLQEPEDKQLCRQSFLEAVSLLQLRHLLDSPWLALVLDWE